MKWVYLEKSQCLGAYPSLVYPVKFQIVNEFVRLARLNVFGRTGSYAGLSPAFISSTVSFLDFLLNAHIVSLLRP